MKKLIILAGCIALAACSKGDAPAAEPDAQVTAEPAAADHSMAGSYEMTAADGSKSTTVMAEDGTYTATAADGTVTTGTVAMVKDQTCFNSSAEGSAPDCWTDGEPAADGSWVSTNDDGVKVTVRKL